jgi:hypothetical protein
MLTIQPVLGATIAMSPPRKSFARSAVRRLHSWQTTRRVAALLTAPTGRGQQRGVGCADCCSAEPGRRVARDERLLSAAALGLSKHEVAETLATASPDRALGAIAHRDSVAVLVAADFCNVGRMQQSRAAHDAAGARPLRKRERAAEVLAYRVATRGRTL